MKVSHTQSWQVRRQRDYLAAWPAHAQLEALHDAANGKPEKLVAMNAHFDEVRARHPKTEG